MLQLRVHAEIEPFLAAAENDLAQDEVTNGLILGVALRLKRYPARFEHAPFLATVHEGDALVAAGVMTPPYGLLVYAAVDEPRPALRLIAQALVAAQWPLPTVNGVAAPSTS